MSKVQCFKITEDGERYYIVSHNGLELFFGFKFKPKEETFKRCISGFFDPYVGEEIDRVINVLASNPEKIWEVEV